MKKCLAIITTHPIQYQVPLFKALEKVKELKSYVFYGCDQGVNKTKIDKDFNKKFSWNISMLSGYKFFFSKYDSNYEDWFLRFPNISKKLDKINCNCILILGWNKIIYFQAILYAIKKKIPIMLRAENNLNLNTNIFKKILKNIFFRILFSFFSKIFYIGKLNKFFYLYYGVKKSKLCSAPYFVDNNFFHKKIKKSNKTFNILFIGKFIKRKNPFDILKIAESLKNYKNIKFTLIGDGPLLPVCQDWIRKKDISNINFRGFKNQMQMRQIYNQNHILINSSTYETWGLVVNEAMSAGVPCIITDKTGCGPDLIIKGKTGYIYPVGNLDILKKYILKIYKNKRVYFRMSSNVKNIIKKNSINKTAFSISRSTISLCQELKKY